jgi:hypothetical protein
MLVGYGCCVLALTCAYSTNSGWATRIRTWISASKGHCPTIERSPSCSTSFHSCAQNHGPPARPAFGRGGQKGHCPTIERSPSCSTSFHSCAQGHGPPTRPAFGRGGQKGHCPTIERSPSSNSRRRVSPAQRQTVNGYESRLHQYSARGSVRVRLMLRTLSSSLCFPSRFCAASASPRVWYNPKRAEPDPESEA